MNTVVGYYILVTIALLKERNSDLNKTKTKKYYYVMPMNEYQFSEKDLVKHAIIIFYYVLLNSKIVTHTFRYYILVVIALLKESKT